MLHFNTVVVLKCKWLLGIVLSIGYVVAQYSKLKVGHII